MRGTRRLRGTRAMRELVSDALIRCTSEGLGNAARLDSPQDKTRK